MFENTSRYYRLEVYHVTDRRGRQVAVVPAAPDPGERALGIHQLKQGQRLDHLAFKYLDDATAFWRICELNGVMLPETLSEQPEIAIPNKFQGLLFPG
jgi:hypothetical protein